MKDQYVWAITFFSVAAVMFFVPPITWYFNIAGGVATIVGLFNLFDGLSEES